MSKSEVLSALKQSLRDLEDTIISPDELHLLQLKQVIRTKISELEGGDEIAA
jgi:hypothetical protein